MDIDDEIIELIFNDYRITNDCIKGYNITNNALFKEEAAITTLGIEATVIYEIKHSGDVQDGEMEAS